MAPNESTRSADLDNAPSARLNENRNSIVARLAFAWKRPRGSAERPAGRTPGPLQGEATGTSVIKSFLLAPGPTPVPPEVLAAMALPVIHHRTPQFGAVLAEVQTGLRELFGTKEDVLILAASGTGAMESAVTNLLSAGDEAIVVNGGKFGERWSKICQAYGVTVHEIKVPWGAAVTPDAVRAALDAHPNARALYLQASETSTCVQHPVEA